MFISLNKDNASSVL